MKSAVVAVLAVVGCAKSAPPATGWNVADYWKQAEAAARAWHDDAELVLIAAGATDVNGVSHLETLDAHLRFEYRSQVDLVKTAAERVGASAGRPPNCLFSVYIHAQRTQVSTGMRTGDCAGPRLGPVKCTVTRIWQRALAQGAPAIALANIELDLSGAVRRWRFVIVDHASKQPLFDENFDDDC
ncbi:hypothetical protein BH11MYX1_BH11MYX1_25470 [soil metagenome]